MDTITAGLSRAWTNFMDFLPNLFLFLVILVVGYFVAKLVGKLVTALLRRFDFNRLGQHPTAQRITRGRTYNYAGIVGAVVQWTLFVFVLQLAFSAFGPNPISAILTSFIMYLPRIFYALAMVALASLLAAGVNRLLDATLGGVSFGRTVSGIVSGLIVAVGIFAALDELNVARAIVDGLFYAMLAIIVGSGIIAIGCGGIAPMRAEWTRTLNRLHREGARMQAQETMEHAEEVTHEVTPTEEPVRTSRFPAQ